MSNWKLTTTRSITTLTTNEGLIYMKVDDIIDWLKTTQGKTEIEESKELIHMLIKSLVRMKNQKI